MKAQGVKIKYLVGTMIEVPRGALTADQIADRGAEFFSFGTNDLTQLTFGFSRDDVGKFLKIYQDKKILEKDPFASIDVEGVGALVRIGVERGRKTRNDLKIGICGEHGGDPASIHFFEKVGLDYVSASPYRVPVARLRRGAGGAGGQGRGLITIFVHRNGQTEQATSIDRAWLNPAAGAFVWVDLAAPSIPESLILSDTFAFHPLSVEDAMSAPCSTRRSEAYDGYLYVILHGIDFHAGEHGFATHDVDFFLGANYLVTVHDGHSRSIAELLREHCPRNPKILGEGPVALFHRIVDAMVDHYRPEVEKLEDRLDELEKAVFDEPDAGAGARDPRREARRLVAAPRRHAAARRHRAARAARIRRHQHRRCRSASATSTTTSSGSPTMR